MAKTKVHGEYLDPSVISGQTQVTAVGADSMLIFDATDNALKKALLSDLIETVGSTPTFSQISATSDLTLDVAGDIILDAAGDNWLFKKSGATLLNIQKDSDNVEFISSISDGDMKFRGNDGGSLINALTLDMSEAGKALFNAGASFGSDISIVSTGDGLSLSRSGYDTYSLQHSTGNGMAIRNITDSRTEMFFDGAGNVGIGTTSPINTFQVEGTFAVRSSSSSIFNDSSNAENVRMLDAGTTFNADGIDKDFTVKSDNNAAMFVVDGGNDRVGIGTSSPAFRLDVQDTSDPAQIRLKEDGNTNGFIFKNWNGNEAQLVNADNGPMVFKTNDTERMRIQSDGALKLLGGDTSGIQEIFFNNGGLTINYQSQYTLSGILNTGALIAIGQQRSQQGVTYDHCLIFAELGTDATILANPSGRFAINSNNTSNKTNIYVSGNSVVIMNEVGTNQPYTIAVFRFQGN